MRIVGLEISGTVPFVRAVNIELPERGVVLLSGPNGAGKSSVIDAAALGLYRRTLRRRSDSAGDAMPWREGEKARVCVHLAGGRSVVLERSARGKITHDIGDGVAYETADAARDAFAREFYDFEQWRRTCVLTGASVGYFSAAGDAERKAFIEGLLGLDQADAKAEELVRTERARQALFDAAERRKFAANTEVDVLARAVEDAEKATFPGSLEFYGPLADEASAIFAAGGEEALQAFITQSTERLTEELNKARALGNEENKRWTQARAGANEASAVLRALQSGEHTLRAGDCDRCGQTVSAEHAAAQTAEMGRRIHVARKAFVDARDASEAHQAAFRNAQARFQEVSAQQEHVNGVANAFHAYARAEAAFRSRNVEQRIKAYAAACARVDGVSAECAAAEYELDVVRKARAVLTVARSRVLASALASLTDVVNGYLARLGASYSVRVSAVSRTASGEVRERISIDVDGAGNGYGYGGCSSGQRKRIDVALLLGLAELARSSRGVDGVLWLDELFGHLDAEGREAAARLVREIAAERCVVVVEHDAAMEEALKPSRTYAFTDGEVTG